MHPKLCMSLACKLRCDFHKMEEMGLEYLETSVQFRRKSHCTLLGFQHHLCGPNFPLAVSIS